VQCSFFYSPCTVTRSLRSLSPARPLWKIFLLRRMLPSQRFKALLVKLASWAPPCPPLFSSGRGPVFLDFFEPLPLSSQDSRHFNRPCGRFFLLPFSRSRDYIFSLFVGPPPNCGPEVFLPPPLLFFSLKCTSLSPNP